MDKLLWLGATAAASRQLAYTSPAKRSVFAARLAMRSGAVDAAFQASAVESANPSITRTDPAMQASPAPRSEEHTSELQSLMRISYAVFCLQKKTRNQVHKEHQIHHLKPKQQSLGQQRNIKIQRITQCIT